MPKPEIDDVDPYHTKLLEDLLLQKRLKANLPRKAPPPVAKTRPPVRGLKKWEPTLPSAQNKATRSQDPRGTICPPKAGMYFDTKKKTRPSVKTNSIKPPTCTTGPSRLQAPSSRKMGPSCIPPKTSAACKPQVSNQPLISKRQPAARPSQSRLNTR